jgi:hypothetical protein
MTPSAVNPDSAHLNSVNPDSAHLNSVHLDVNSVDLDAWHDFFVASAGAAAALAGLIIVAMTVNISTILQMAAMPSRAAATIGSLTLSVVVSVSSLIPGQALWLLGAETLVFSVGALALAITAARQILRHRDGVPRRALGAKIVVIIAQILPFLVGSILLLASAEVGLHWNAAGIVVVFIGSVVSAWILLVEILR